MQHNVVDGRKEQRSEKLRHKTTPSTPQLYDFITSAQTKMNERDCRKHTITTDCKTSVFAKNEMKESKLKCRVFNMAGLGENETEHE